MIYRQKMKLRAIAVFVGLAIAMGSGTAYAATTADTQFSQTITGGSMATFVGDSSGGPIATPSISFPGKSVSTSTQTSVATFGDSSNRIYVDNPGSAATNWTLTLAPTGGAIAVWSSGSDTYPFNGATAADGELTIDPSSAVITADPVGGSTSGITNGTSYTYTTGAAPVTLMSASISSGTISRVYMTGVGFSQTIPASTPSGTYTINFTQTLASS